MVDEGTEPMSSELATLVPNTPLNILQLVQRLAKVKLEPMTDLDYDAYAGAPEGSYIGHEEFPDGTGCDWLIMPDSIQQVMFDKDYEPVSFCDYEIKLTNVELV
jgi:hypothetical protein